MDSPFISCLIKQSWYNRTDPNSGESAMLGIRIMELPTCKMVSSDAGTVGKKAFQKFYQWFSNLPNPLFLQNFLYEDGEERYWLYPYRDGMKVPDEFKLIDFPGGLYFVATDIDQQTNMDAPNYYHYPRLLRPKSWAIIKWITISR